MRFWKKKISTDIRNPQLVKAMMRLAAENTPQARSALYNRILKSCLVIPTPELPEGIRSGPQKLDKSVPFQILVMTEPAGKKTTAVFTDEEALRHWDPNTPWFEMEAREFFALLVKTDADEVIINPFDPVRKMLRPIGRLTRPEFTALANDMTLKH